MTHDCVEPNNATLWLLAMKKQMRSHDECPQNDHRIYLEAADRQRFEQLAFLDWLTRRWCSTLRRNCRRRGRRQAYVLASALARLCGRRYVCSEAGDDVLVHSRLPCRGCLCLGVPTCNKESSMSMMNP